MNPNHVLLLAIVGVLLGGCSQTEPVAIKSTATTHEISSVPPTFEKGPDKIVGRAASYLWEKQSADGSWRSETYGLLGSGQSLTPFVLHSLLQVSETVPPDGAIDRALDFMRARISKQGALGLHDPDILDYPNYSTAFALMCFKLRALEQDKSLIERMEKYLIDQQFCEANGFEESSLAYGGWGFGGTHPLGETGHMDLAHTRYVLQAIALEPRCDERWPDVQQRAQHFLRLVQKHPDEQRQQPIAGHSLGQNDANNGFDGGFYFSPVILRANKGRVETDSSSSHWRSYATATCDGLMALLAAGVSRDDMRAMQASKWLDDHTELSYPEGIPQLYEGENWREAVFFYHLAVRGESARAIPTDSNRARDRIAAQICQLQNPDGSFQNRNSALMKEDDPILCTALVMTGLAK